MLAADWRLFRQLGRKTCNCNTACSLVCWLCTSNLLLWHYCVLLLRAMSSLMPNRLCSLMPCCGCLLQRFHKVLLLSCCGCLLQRYHEVLLLTHHKHQEWGEGMAAALDMPHQQHKVLAQMAKAEKAQVGSGRLRQGLSDLIEHRR